ncbi:hypothetical protein GCM10028791_21190 [Echinicola sediminis]
MKALLASALVLGMVFLAKANEVPDRKSLLALTSVETNDERINVSFKEPVGKAVVLIFDEEGKVLARNKYNVKKAMNIPYNLSDLPEGDYAVRIKTRDETATYNVETKSKAVTYERPIVAYGKIKDNNTINLMVLGIEEPGIRVDIFDENNKKVATDNVDVTEGFERNYKVVDRKVEGLTVRIKDAQGRKKYIYF